MDYNLQKNQNAEQTYHSIRNSIVSAQHRLSTAVNSAMVTTYWEIGEQIFKACGENDRAEYGKKLLEYLSEQLTAEFGKGFDKSNLRKMRQFYCTFPIRDTLCPELSWSHYRVLMRINDEQARRYFMKKAPKEINSVFGYRTSMSMKNKDTWEFAHKYCGKVWYVCGMVLLPITVIFMLLVIGKSEDCVGSMGGIICGVQLIPLIGSILPTEIAFHRHTRLYRNIYEQIPMCLYSS